MDAPSGDARIVGGSLAEELVDGRARRVVGELLRRGGGGAREPDARGGVYGLHGPDLDEDLGVEGSLRGAPSGER